MVELKNVTVSLGGGVVVETPATVFPEWLEPCYDPGRHEYEDIVLDAHQMRRGHMVQVFRPVGSDLFVKKPE